MQASQITSLLRRGVHRLRRTLHHYPTIRRGLRRIAPSIGPALAAWLHRPEAIGYAGWIAQFDTLNKADRAAIRGHIARFVRRPLISVVMPVYNPEEKALRQAIASIEAQLYPYWELCIADDASTAPYVGRVLSEATSRDDRIKVITRATNGNISAASNSALSLTVGEFVALMDHDGLLPEHALYEVAAELQVHPDADLIYSDEDKVDRRSRRYDAVFKTDWNADLLLGQDMISHLGVYRRALVNQLGGFRPGFEGSQDYDLALRVFEQTMPGRIRHIPAILYHWCHDAANDSFSRSRLEQCASAGRRAVTEHLERVGEHNARVLPNPNIAAFNRIVWPLSDPLPLVSVIVPTRDQAELLAQCADALLRRTHYPAIELLIVDNGSTEAATLALLQRVTSDPRVRILACPGPFNYSALNNQAAGAARGEILLLLNNDVDVIEPGWLREMVSLVVRPTVGAVGAKLLYADGRLQHGGIVLGVGGVANHFEHGVSRYDHGYTGRLTLVRDVSAVTGACLAVRRDVYHSVGGLDAVNLPIAFNDVDFCLRLRERGFRVLWTPFAELYHLESASRGPDTTEETLPRFQREIAYMRKRWSAIIDADPFYNPNCSLERGDYSPAPPRRPRPWRAQEKGPSA